MSDRVRKSAPFRFMEWRLGVSQGDDEKTDREIEAALTKTVNETDTIDAAVVLAFDAVHDKDGQIDRARTHLYVTNDYAIELCRRHRKLLFGASVHPYREDAVAELERCVRAGAVLLKWLPIVQDIDPSDDRCLPFYEALAHYKLPLLSHTGGEKSLPNINVNVMDPALLEPAIERGATVIAAHCGTRSAAGETDYLPTFMRMAREHERFFGDTAALNLPTRSYAFKKLLADKVVREKLVHGSDWPIISIPPAMTIGLRDSVRAWTDANWMRRDVTIKRMLGFDDAYFRRTETVLRLV